MALSQNVLDLLASWIGAGPVNAAKPVFTLEVDVWDRVAQAKKTLYVATRNYRTLAGRADNS